MNLLQALLMEAIEVDDPFAEPKPASRQAEYEDAEKRVERIGEASRFTLDNIRRMINDPRLPVVVYKSHMANKKFSGAGAAHVDDDCVYFSLNEKNPWNRYPTYVGSGVWVWKGMPNVFQRVRTLVKQHNSLCGALVEAKKRVSYLRTAARQETLHNEKQATNAAQIPESQVPKHVVGYDDNTTAVSLKNPYWRSGFREGNNRVTRYAGSPAHFNDWPSKTKSMYVDMNTLLKAGGIVDGFSVLYAGTADTGGSYKKTNVKFIAVADNGNFVWSYNSDSDNFLYTKGKGRFDVISIQRKKRINTLNALRMMGLSPKS